MLSFCISHEECYIPAVNFVDCSRRWLGFYRTEFSQVFTMLFSCWWCLLTYTHAFLNCCSFCTTWFQATRTPLLQMKLKDFQYKQNYLQRQCYQEMLQHVQEVANDILVHIQSFKKTLPDWGTNTETNSFLLLSRITSTTSGYDIWPKPDLVSLIWG